MYYVCEYGCTNHTTLCMRVYVCVCVCTCVCACAMCEWVCWLCMSVCVCEVRTYAVPTVD